MPTSSNGRRSLLTGCTEKHRGGQSHQSSCPPCSGSMVGCFTSWQPRTGRQRSRRPYRAAGRWNQIRAQRAAELSSRSVSFCLRIHLRIKVTITGLLALAVGPNDGRAPMLRGDDVIGVIIVTWRDPGPIVPSEVELRQTLADKAVTPSRTGGRSKRNRRGPGNSS
jgi:hypothetical protein